MTKPTPAPNPVVRFAYAAGAIFLLAAPWLVELVRFAVGSDLYSHLVLVPLVSFGLVWIRRAERSSDLGRAALQVEGHPAGNRAGESSRVAAAGACALAAAAALAYALLAHPSPELEPHHQLTWSIAAYVLALVGTGFWFLGWRFMRANTVAFGFLVFLIPMPGWLERATEIALQRGSAEAASVLFSLSGVPFLRDGQVFRLPSITMEIAQECSGIHSSLVLFITSIVAGQMFLRPGWRRWTLTLAVLPLALIRNGFRVVTLGGLCERIGPHMIDHWIHHRGGPIFFALSLIPFFLLLYALARLGRKNPPASPDASPRSSMPARDS